MILIGSLAACDSGPCPVEPNTLEGSISEIVEISPVDTVGARLSNSDDTVTIDFKKGNDSVAKVVADVATFAVGASIPLVDGDVYRVTSPVSDFPNDIDSGRVLFETELSIGNQVTGCFNVTFNSAEGRRTLEGSFDTTLEEGL